MITSIIIISIFVITLSFGTKYLGQQPSISDFYYALEKIKKGLGALFIIWCFSIGFSETIILTQLLQDEWYSILGVGCGAGLMFVGAAPMFKIKPDRLVHIIAAAIAAVSGILICILTGYYYVLLTSLLICLIVENKTKTQDTTYWVEVAIFISVFITQVILSVK